MYHEASCTSGLIHVHVLLLLQCVQERTQNPETMLNSTKLCRIIQLTLPKSNLHKSNNRLSRSPLQVLFSLFSIVFHPT